MLREKTSLLLASEISIAGHLRIEGGRLLTHAEKLTITEALKSDKNFEEYPYDDERFNKGTDHVVQLLAKVLDVTNWAYGDGSEDHDCDLGQTLLNILEAKCLYDGETGVFAKVPNHG